MNLDDIVKRALAGVAAAPIYTGEKPPEASLVVAMRRRLADDPALDVLDGEPRYRLPHWTRDPGGVDIAADVDAEGRVLFEAKVGKPDEALWDAIKLADITASSPTPPILASYLLYDGDQATWRSEIEGAGLFLQDEQARGVAEMIEQWPRAWRWLLIGGRGIRPHRSTSLLNFSPVMAVSLEAHPGRTLRLVRVGPAGESPQEFDDDGWPVGYEPPADLRLRERNADRWLSADRPQPPADRDPCHGYPWYAMWTQSRLNALVPNLDDEAYGCLRARLNRERAWSEAELRERVDPLRESDP